MKDMDAKTWMRRGSSIVWSPDLLGSLITNGSVVPLRTALRWMTDGFPDDTPDGGKTLLIGGLQAILETAGSSEEAYDWLRANIMPFLRSVQGHWPRVGIVFGMTGPRNLFYLSEGDDLVYFGRSKDRSKKVRITLGMWNGAATGEGAFQLMTTGAKKEVGGYHVNHIS
jgi:hypothetical protein